MKAAVNWILLTFTVPFATSTYNINSKLQPDIYTLTILNAEEWNFISWAKMLFLGREWGLNDILW